MTLAAPESMTTWCIATRANWSGIEVDVQPHVSTGDASTSPIV